MTYERFTDRARRVMQLANQEAQRMNHAELGAEHILIALLKEGAGTAARCLGGCDVNLRNLRNEVEKLHPSGPEMITMGRLPMDELAQQVLGGALREADALNHSYVATEHILLGLLEGPSVATTALDNLIGCRNDIREVVMQLIKPEENKMTDRQLLESIRERIEILDDRLKIVLEYVKRLDQNRPRCQESLSGVQCDLQANHDGPHQSSWARQ